MNLKLDELTWTSGEHLRATWKEHNNQPTRPHKNCYLVFFKDWQVKLFLGKEQRLLGTSRDGVTACRFADMAIYYFLPYRKRDRPLVDSDLNFSVSQAERDLEENPTAKHFLEQLERALISRSLIVRTQKLFTVDNRPDDKLREELYQTFSKFESVCASVQQRLTGAGSGDAILIDMLRDFCLNGSKLVRASGDSLMRVKVTNPVAPEIIDPGVM